MVQQSESGKPTVHGPYSARRASVCWGLFYNALQNKLCNKWNVYNLLQSWYIYKVCGNSKKIHVSKTAQIVLNTENNDGCSKESLPYDLLFNKSINKPQWWNVNLSMPWLWPGCISCCISTLEFRSGDFHTRPDLTIYSSPLSHSDSMHALCLCWTGLKGCRSILPNLISPNSSPSWVYRKAPTEIELGLGLGWGLGLR